MDHAYFPMRELAPEIAVERFIGELITTCGYDGVISDLVFALYHLGQASLDNPQDIATHRDFTLWANAVRAAILKHGDTSTFADRINNFDRCMAGRMGIILE